MEYLFYPTPIGLFRIDSENEAIVGGHWINDRDETTGEKSSLHTETKFSLQIINELDKYFQGQLHTFSIALQLKGSEFEMKVWNELLKIPYGETVTYGEIAQRIGHKGGARAVGMACKKNPIGIFVPCHRVISARGNRGGYNGGLERKEFLLELEGRHVGIFSI